MEPSKHAVSPSYLLVREDIVSLTKDLALGRVLDVGCAAGATSRVLKMQHPNARVTGVEHNESLARDAERHVDRVVVGDAAQVLERFAADNDERYELVLCGDILEHLPDPWRALSLIRRICPRGHVIVSLPNVAHWSTIFSLLGARWPYRDRGIHDRTHLRFFGRNDLSLLYADAGFRELRRLTHHRLVERPHRINEKVGSALARIPVVARLTEYQFVSLLH